MLDDPPRGTAAGGHDAAVRHPRGTPQPNPPADVSFTPKGVDGRRWKRGIRCISGPGAPLPVPADVLWELGKPANGDGPSEQGTGEVGGFAKPSRAVLQKPSQG